MAKKLVNEEKPVGNVSTKLVTCACKSEYQDQKYGKSKRVANAVDGGKAKKSGVWRCTVCGKEYTVT
jgi:hypothetical protein